MHLNEILSKGHVGERSLLYECKPLIIIYMWKAAYTHTFKVWINIMPEN